MRTRTLGPAALLCVSLLFIASVAHADGTISGVIINGFTGDPVRGATLVVEGTDISFGSGVGGDFRSSVPAGTYSVVVTKDGFETQRVTDLVVRDGGNADFAVVMLPASDAPPIVDEPEAVPAPAADTVDESEEIGSATSLESAPVVADAAPAAAATDEPDAAGDSGVFIGQITVEAAADDATEVALLAERKNAAEISDAIGSEEMKKNTGSNAADVVKRVTGISIQNDKFVYVRGLGERYSNTALNGAQIPSTEFEKKVVPFDLFPAPLLESIKVSKSYTVDRPGSFGAGEVKLETKDFPVEQIAEIGFGLSHHSIATGEQFARYGSGLDFFGGGGQGLPSGIPDDKLVRLSPITGEGFTPSELQDFGLQLIGVWRGTAGEIGTPWGGGSYSAPIDNGLNVTYGNTFGKFGLVLSGVRSQTNRARTEARNFYRVSELNDSGITELHSFDIDYNTETVKDSILANLAYRFSDNHQLAFRTMANSIGQGITKYQSGFFSDLASDIREYEVNYKNQEINTFQLSGEHFLGVGKLGSLLEWFGSTSQANTSQDMRFSLYQRKGEDFILTDNSSSGFMFFNDLEDTVNDGQLNWTTFLSGNNLYGSFKGGIAYTDRARDFVGRRLRYKQRGQAGLDLTEAPEVLFDDPYINAQQFEIEETTRSTDAYVADQEIGAAYGQIDIALSKWRFIGGVRYEASDINLQAFDIFTDEQTDEPVELQDRDWLPSLSVVYRLNQKANLRFSASQTVNRPEFRELAPFKFSDSVGFFERRGNPDLVSAHINAADLRWEWFPSSTDVIAASVFFKNFEDPIETVIIEAVTRAETWINAEAANNQGIEVELRRTLNPNAKNIFTAIVNYSYIDSEISLPEGGIQTNPNRPMVGQPDNVLNLVGEWTNPAWGSTFRLLYNYTGERVAFAGANGLPDVLEDPFASLDFSFRQQWRALGMDWTARITARNLFEDEIEYTQGGELFRGWQPGRTFGIGLKLTFF